MSYSMYDGCAMYDISWQIRPLSHFGNIIKSFSNEKKFRFLFVFLFLFGYYFADVVAKFRLQTAHQQTQVFPFIFAMMYIVHCIWCINEYGEHTCTLYEKTCQDKLQARINDRRNNVSWKSQLKYENKDQEKEEENRQIICCITHTHARTHNHNLDKREKMMKAKQWAERKIYTKIIKIHHIRVVWTDRA